MSTRSTGYRSLNKHVHGHAADIAEQEKLPKPLVYQWICLMAVAYEIIDTVPVVSKALPMHESQWSSAQAAAVVDMIHAEADTRGWWLTEYSDEGVATKMHYGRKP